MYPAPNKIISLKTQKILLRPNFWSVVYIQHKCSRNNASTCACEAEKTCLKCSQHLPENNVIFWLGCFNWLELCCPLSSIQKTPQRMFELSYARTTAHVATVCMKVKTVSLCHKERFELSTWQVIVWGPRGSMLHTTRPTQSRTSAEIKREWLAKFWIQY